MDIASAKKACRQELLELRAQLTPAERADQALKLGSNIAAFLDARKLPDGLTVGVYAAMEQELNLTPTCALLYGMGATVAFPCVFSRESMEFYALSASDLDTPPVFYTAPASLHAPEDVSTFQHVAPQQLDLIVIPALGYDKERRRIGYGWGCYDRYLARVNEDCLKIGVCFDDQLVEALPVEPQDLPVDVVITPTVAY